MQSLTDRFCPNTHDAAITAAAYDPDSGTVATADANGFVAIQRTGEASPRLVFQPGGRVNGALALIRGGSMVAVGDENGTIGMYRCVDGTPVFREEREGNRGLVRAMRGISINPTGSLVAAIAKDGLLRLWDLNSNERDAWREFTGTTVQFDQRGERVLLIDPNGHPQLFDLTTRKPTYMDKLKTPATKAQFSPCGTMVLAGGSGGISLLRVSDGALITSFATRGGSGIQNLLISPDGSQAAAITARSVHVFSMPNLDPIDSYKHGAPDTTGAAIWHAGGVRVGGGDGLMHGGGGGSLGPVTAIAGTGPHRVLIHREFAAAWQGDQRHGVFKIDSRPAHIALNRSGQILALLVPNVGLRIHDFRTGTPLFSAEPDTGTATSVHAGGDVVSIQSKTSGIQWWHLANNRGFSLPWPITHALSGSGTWLGVVTPKGAVRILDPATGHDAIAAPIPLSDTPVQLIEFMNRSPSLLVLDSEGVLGHYDLADSAQTGTPARGTDILSINVPVDRIWGITGGELAALRLPDAGRASILWVNIHTQEVVGEVNDLPCQAEVDNEHGRILVPARAGALLELDSKGRELRVIRDLPDDQWISFSSTGVLAASDGAGGSV